MSIISTLLLAGLICAPAIGQKLSNGKPDLTGRWELQTRDGSPMTGSARVIDQTDARIRIRTVEPGKDESIEVDCGTRGQECGATVRGNEAKVTLWYNGDTLVEMARIGKDEVVETQRAVSDDGNQLTVTVTTLAPAPKDAEKYVFVRAPKSSTRAAVEGTPKK